MHVPTSFTPFMPLKTTHWLNNLDPTILQTNLDMFAISGIMTLMLLNGTGMMHGDLHMHNLLTIPLPCHLGFKTRYGGHSVHLPFTPCVSDFDCTAYVFYGTPDETIFKHSVINCLLHLLCLQHYAWKESAPYMLAIVDGGKVVNPLINALQEAIRYKDAPADIMLHQVMTALFQTTQFTALINHWMVKVPIPPSDVRLPPGKHEINLMFNATINTSILHVANFSSSVAGRELNMYLLRILNTPLTLQEYYNVTESSVLKADAASFPSQMLRLSRLIVTIKLCIPQWIVWQNVSPIHYNRLLMCVPDVNMLNLWIRSAVSARNWVSPELSNKSQPCQFIEPTQSILMRKPKIYIGKDARKLKPYSSNQLSLLLY